MLELHNSPLMDGQVKTGVESERREKGHLPPARDLDDFFRFLPLQSVHLSGICLLSVRTFTCKFFPERGENRTSKDVKGTIRRSLLDYKEESPSHPVPFQGGNLCCLFLEYFRHLQVNTFN